MLWGWASGGFPGASGLGELEYSEMWRIQQLLAPEKKIPNIHDVQFSHKTQVDFSFSQHSPPPSGSFFFFFFSPSQEARGPRHRAAYTAILCFRPGTFPASVTEFNLRETTEVPPSGIHTALVLRAGGKRRQILYTKRGPHD